MRTEGGRGRHTREEGKKPDWFFTLLGKKPRHVIWYMSFTWNPLGGMSRHLLDPRSLREERLAKPWTAS